MGGQEGKIFVGGLNWVTTTESLRAHFERFGAISDCVIMKVGRPANHPASLPSHCVCASRDP
jgi:RNA recognition motif-containing protein